jgi:protein NrfC
MSGGKKAHTTKVKATDYSRWDFLIGGGKYAGCTTCMLARSLTHEGVQGLSVSRIQIMHDSFGKFPYDIIMAACRQSVTPVCVVQCPVDAAYADTAGK